MRLQAQKNQARQKVRRKPDYNGSSTHNAKDYSNKPANIKKTFRKDTNLCNLLQKNPFTDCKIGSLINI